MSNIERDFKWLTAVLSTTCTVCLARIDQGTNFYYEAVERKHYCRDCGRAIKAHGYDIAVKERNGFMKMLRDIGL